MSVFGVGYGVQSFFRSGYAEKQVVDCGGESGQFAVAFNLRDYPVAFTDGFNLQPNWGFEVVRRNRFCNGFRGFIVLVLKRYRGLQVSHL